MLSHLSYLSERYPVKFGIAIFAMISAIPGAVMLIASAFGSDATYLIIAYAFALQMLLCFTAERTIHLMLPFITCIICFVILDFIYFAQILVTQVGASGNVKLALSLGMSSGTVFVTEVIGVVAALIAYAIICFIRGIIKK